jgi:NitT/TauT family transport system substrate-binding protein
LIADAGYNPYTTVLVTTRQRLLEKPDEVKAVALAVQKGWADYLKFPDETNRAMTKLNPAMDFKTMQESALAQKALIETAEAKSAGLGVMTFARWQVLIDQLADIKLIKSKPDPAQMFKSF